MENKRVLVYITNQIYQANILEEIFSDNGIMCFIINKMDSSYLFGDIELYVDPDDVLRAKDLIKKFENS